MTINIGSDLTRPFTGRPLHIKRRIIPVGCVCVCVCVRVCLGAGGRGERHVSECVAAISFTGSGKKHTRGRVSDRMHPLTPAEARARPFARASPTVPRADVSVCIWWLRRTVRSGLTLPAAGVGAEGGADRGGREGGRGGNV